jgi:hypothetical protein
MASKKGNLTALVYASTMSGIQDIGESHGYAIAIHGSMQRDFDLIAVPWKFICSPPEKLVEDICKGFELLMDGSVDGPEYKAHGRMAWSIPICGGLYFDLSVMPTVKEKV